MRDNYSTFTFLITVTKISVFQSCEISVAVYVEKCKFTCINKRTVKCD